jgi:hypothetical protein
LGSSLYRTQIDLNNTGFKCSCPSRKFPCKHGLGLYLIFVRNSAAIPETETEPDWVKDWIDKRQDRAEKKAEDASKPITDEVIEKKSKQKAKSQNKRLDEVSGGVAALDLWLRDLLRAGFLNLPDKNFQFWQKTAARMVDAKAPGLGNLVKEFGNINFFDAQNWQSAALTQAARIFLLLEAFKNYEKLPETLQEDVKSLIGINKTQKELLESAGSESLKDIWLNLGRQRFKDDENDLTIQKDWLYGFNAKRFALLLNFAYKNQPIQVMLVPATATHADLVFYPSYFPLRAVVKGQGNTVANLPEPDFLPDWKESTDFLAEIQTKMPWIDEIPVLVEDLRLVFNISRWFLQDNEDFLMPLLEEFDEDKILQLLALSGGVALKMALIYKKNAFLPLGIWYEGKYILL